MIFESVILFKLKILLNRSGWASYAECAEGVGELRDNLQELFQSLAA